MKESVLLLLLVCTVWFHLYHFKSKLFGDKILVFLLIFFLSNFLKLYKNKGFPQMWAKGNQ